MRPAPETPFPPEPPLDTRDPSAPADRRDDRRAAWLAARLDERGETRLAAPAPMRADASFRRFERVRTDAGDRVLMDAPPATEDSAAFVRVCAWLERVDLPAPRILAADLDEGFLLVTDLGEATLAERLPSVDEHGRRALYRTALDLLVDFQAAAQRDPPPLPAYDAVRLARENALFGEWFVAGRLGLAVPGLLGEALERLSEVHLAAPRAAVHLDWHSRNLISRPDGGLAMVDVQDARIGPVAYDVVSLLRDCYVALGDDEIEAGLAHYLDRAAAAGVDGVVAARGEGGGIADRAAFRRDFDLIGIQRHLKAVGIFSRLSLRDGRDHALGDIPHVLSMIARVGARHPETGTLAAWVREIALPAARDR